MEGWQSLGLNSAWCMRLQGRPCNSAHNIATMAGRHKRGLKCPSNFSTAYGAKLAAEITGRVLIQSSLSKPISLGNACMLLSVLSATLCSALLAGAAQVLP